MQEHAGAGGGTAGEGVKGGRGRRACDKGRMEIGGEWIEKCWMTGCAAKVTRPSRRSWEGGTGEGEGPRGAYGGDNGLRPGKPPGLGRAGPGSQAGQTGRTGVAGSKSSRDDGSRAVGPWKRQDTKGGGEGWQFRQRPRDRRREASVSSAARSPE